MQGRPRIQPDPVTVGPWPKALAHGGDVVLRYDGDDQFKDTEKIVVWTPSG